jgi:hypothetical protein
MSFFSDIGNFFQNDIIDPVANLFKPAAPDPSVAAATVAATQALTDATTAATQATKNAQLQAEAAATPPTDSESARSASDDQLRKTLAGGVYGVGMPATTGAAPVGYRLLSGSP